MAGRQDHDGDARLLRRVRLRLVLWSGAITLAIVAILGVAVYVTVDQALSASGRDLLGHRTAAIAPLIQDRLRPGDAGTRFLGFATGGSSSGTYAIVVAPDGTVIGPVGEAAFPGLPVASAVTAARAGAPDYQELTVAGLPVRMLSTPITATAGSVYVVQVIADRTGDVHTLEVVLQVLIAGGLVAVALSLAGGAVYAQRALVPIRESLRRQREFAADASHELRTPLAVVRGNLEHLQRHPDQTVATLRESVDDARATVDHMTDLVESLLLLARADSGVAELEHVPVDLADVAAAALDGLATPARERDVHLVLDAAPATLEGDPVRLRQLVTILADNAIRHSPPGTAVRVAVAVTGRQAELTVDDSGPGVRPEDRPHIFERFWRAVDAPPGG
ncbi:MAG TPA: HAMP domain-containing sensor histidine kinase, partial [Candidatus Sulfotelmatobacter sp.]|nr:HAMP domain-containing sensor histidine kinase [Candidatus Sulfotelmatobacter sp.]